MKTVPKLASIKDLNTEGVGMVPVWIVHLSQNAEKSTIKLSCKILQTPACLLFQYLKTLLTLLQYGTLWVTCNHINPSKSCLAIHMSRSSAQLSHWSARTPGRLSNQPSPSISCPEHWECAAPNEAWSRFLSVDPFEIVIFYKNNAKKKICQEQHKTWTMIISITLDISPSGLGKIGTSRCIWRRGDGLQDRVLWGWTFAGKNVWVKSGLRSYNFSHRSLPCYERAERDV